MAHIKRIAAARRRLNLERFGAERRLAKLLGNESFALTSRD